MRSPTPIAARCSRGRSADRPAYCGHWLLPKDVQEGLGKATIRQSRRSDVPAIDSPVQAKPGEDYIELQREAYDEQQQKIMAMSRQLRPD